MISILSYSQNSNIVDKRALNHYSKEELNNMPLNKILKLNYLFSSSFIIPEEMKKNIDPSEVDVYIYGSYRKENEEVKIDLGAPFEKRTGKFIILLPFKDIDDAYKAIDDENCGLKK